MPQSNDPVNLLSFKLLKVPGAEQTTATGLNDRGQVVGHFTDAVGQQHGFLDDAGSFSQPLDYPGATATYATGINNLGQIVGNYQDARGTYGFLYETGIFSPPLIYPGAAATYARRISNRGEIVGCFQDSKGKNNGFLYRAGEFSLLNSPQGKETTLADINDGGQIVGATAAGQGTHGFVYLVNPGVFTSLLDFAGAHVTYPQGLNNRGQIVGNFVDANGKDQAFLGRGGRLVHLRLPGAISVGALDINDRGQIVGNFSDGGGLHAYLAVGIL